MKKLFWSFILLTIINSCQTKNIVEANNNNNYNRKYCLGKGGGFTGEYVEYILYENGKVFKYDFKYDREVFTKELNEADLNYFMKQINDLSLEGISINKPGSITYYIKIKEGENEINNIVWGDSNYYPPDNLVSFFNELYKKLIETE